MHTLRLNTILKRHIICSIINTKLLSTSFPILYLVKSNHYRKKKLSCRYPFKAFPYLGKDSYFKD